jgi:hypothetical protein
MYEGVSKDLLLCAAGDKHYTDSRIGDMALAAANLEDSIDLRELDRRHRCLALRKVRGLYVQVSHLPVIAKTDLATKQAARQAVQRLDRIC